MIYRTQEFISNSLTFLRRDIDAFLVAHPAFVAINVTLSVTSNNYNAILLYSM